jgi:hypothetical protein
MNILTTKPKPFVFVLMPFDSEFDDIYKFGVLEAAQDANAYAERVDEQIFTEGILERIFSQINKADVVVADMTGRSANVFYEVGYAHALGKIVILLTQNVEDIPIDLKHKQKIIYEGSVQILKEQLAGKLIRAIQPEGKLNRAIQPAGKLNRAIQPAEAKTLLRTIDITRRSRGGNPLKIIIDGVAVVPSITSNSGPRVGINRRGDHPDELVVVNVELRNGGNDYSYPEIEKAYISCAADSFLTPSKIIVREKIIDKQAHDNLVEKYELKWDIPELSVSASHVLKLMFQISSASQIFNDDIYFKIILKVQNTIITYPFVIDYRQLKSLY